MTTERTLSIIKPDAVAKHAIGQIISRFEKGGLRIVAAKMMHLSKAQAEQFYGVHKDRPFFAGLVGFMSSGPVLVQVLEGDNAIARNREIMGATNPKDAAPGTIAPDLLPQSTTMLEMVLMPLKPHHKELLSSLKLKELFSSLKKASSPNVIPAVASQRQN